MCVNYAANEVRKSLQQNVELTKQQLHTSRQPGPNLIWTHLYNVSNTPMLQRLAIYIQQLTQIKHFFATKTEVRRLWLSVTTDFVCLTSFCIIIVIINIYLQLAYKRVKFFHTFQ